MAENVVDPSLNFELEKAKKDIKYFQGVKKNLEDSLYIFNHTKTSYGIDAYFSSAKKSNEHGITNMHGFNYKLIQHAKNLKSPKRHYGFFGKLIRNIAFAVHAVVTIGLNFIFLAIPTFILLSNLIATPFINLRKSLYTKKMVNKIAKADRKIQDSKLKLGITENLIKKQPETVAQLPVRKVTNSKINKTKQAFDNIPDRSTFNYEAMKSQLEKNNGRQKDNDKDKDNGRQK